MILVNGTYWTYDLDGCLEEGFSISMETDDIVDFSSFKKGIEMKKNIRFKFKTSF